MFSSTILWMLYNSFSWSILAKKVLRADSTGLEIEGMLP
jgi:hypothetical protein